MRRTLIVVTGFLEAGKTTIINEILDVHHARDNFLIVQCEQGLVELNYRTDIPALVLENLEDMTENYFRQIIKEYQASQILLEYNGTWPLSRLYQLRLPEGLVIDQVIYVLDEKTAHLYLSNMGALILEQIHYADFVLFTKNTDVIRTKDDRVIQIIHELNPDAKIIQNDNAKEAFICKNFKNAFKQNSLKNIAWGFFVGCLFIIVIFWIMLQYL